jgi:hypothetical protein
MDAERSSLSFVGEEAFSALRLLWRFGQVGAGRSNQIGVAHSLGYARAGRTCMGSVLRCFSSGAWKGHLISLLQCGFRNAATTWPCQQLRDCPSTPRDTSPITSSAKSRPPSSRRRSFTTFSRAHAPEPLAGLPYSPSMICLIAPENEGARMATKRSGRSTETSASTARWLTRIIRRAPVQIEQCRALLRFADDLDPLLDASDLDVHFAITPQDNEVARFLWVVAWLAA